MEALTTIMAMVMFFFVLIILLAILAEAFGGHRWYYYSDWHFCHRRQEKLQDEIDDLRSELRTAKQQPPPPPAQAVPTAPPPKQIVEHRHVHVHVGADSQPINAQRLLAPPAVLAKAEQLGGIPVQVPGGWNIERNGQLLLEMRKPPASRMIEMKK